jgi:hypothetical protein
VEAPAGIIRAASAASTSAAVSATFTTHNETVPPTLIQTMPADNAIGVTGSRVVLTFSEPVAPGNGSIIIAGAGGDVRTLAVGDITQVTFNGNTVDINPSADLLPATGYTVQIASGVIVDLAGNPYAGLIGPTALNFTTASAGSGGAPPTMLSAGDIAFMGINADPVDAFAFVLLRDVGAGTQIAFTDKDYSAGATAFPTNEAAFTWTADVDYPAGTIVTVNVDALLVDLGTVYGEGGGISPNAETYYAFQGTILDPNAGQISVDRFLATINLGNAAGEIPAEVTAAGSAMHFDEDNVRYGASLDTSDLAAFAARVRDPSNWDRDDATSFLIVGGTLFP